MQHVAVSKATTEPTRPALETMADIPRAPSTPKVVIWRPSLGYASCSGYRIKGLDGCTRSARRPGKAALLWKPSATTSASRSEEHTSELQSLMRISYAVFCLKKKKQMPVIPNINKKQVN